MKKENAGKLDIWWEEFFSTSEILEKKNIIKKLETFVGIYPGEAQAYFLLAIFKANMGDFVGALESVDKCLSLEIIPDCVILKADILNSMGMVREAIEYTSKAKSYLKGMDRMKLEIREVLYLINIGDYENALNLFKSLSKEKIEKLLTDPDFTETILLIEKELEEYQKGKQWAEQNRNIVNDVEKVFKKYFNIERIIIKLVSDWEIINKPIITLIVDEAIPVEHYPQFFEKEQKALNEFYSLYPGCGLSIFIKPHIQKEEKSVLAV